MNLAMIYFRGYIYQGIKERIMQDSMIPELPDYYAFNELLQSNHALVDAAEAHGIICCLTCAGNIMDGQLWLELLLGVTGVEASISNGCRNALIELYDISSRQLQDENLTFQMLLPNDDIDIDKRVRALGFWCRGFMQGMQLANITGDEVDDEEVVEFFDDIAEIANIDYEDINPLDEDEQNYMEIIEYLRVGVMMVYLEYNTSDDDGDNQHLSELH